MVLRSINKPCSCSETPKSINNIDMVDVQRLSDDVGVKPQANGGRKILALLLLIKKEGWQIVYALGNASGYLYDIFDGVASIGKCIYIIIYK